MAGLLLTGATQETSIIRRCRYPARPDTTWTLPKELREISGLAWFEGRLLAHDDESGRLVAIDPATGRTAPWLSLTGPVRDDFEGIAVISRTAWMMTSRARLYSFPAGAAQAPVAFKAADTQLGGSCEFEGLAADAAGTLLIPCKLLPKGRDGIEIHRWDPQRMRPASPAVLSVPPAQLARAGVKAIRPSAIEVDRSTGHILVLSANPAVLVELDGAGAVLAAVALKRHPQAEGLALGPGNDLYVSDEAVGGPPTIARYRCAK